MLWPGQAGWATSARIDWSMLCLVDDPDDKPQAEQPDGGMRLIVLWLCWVLLAVFLTAAGVVGFG